MRAFLFDLDDTLFDHRHSTRMGLAILRATLKPLASLSPEALEVQHAMVLEELHRRVLAGEMDVDAARKERFRRLVHTQGASVGEHEIEAASRAYRQAYLAARRAVGGAVELLEALRAHGRIAIVSNNVTMEQMEKLKVCGLDGLIDAAVISEAVGVAKPAPEIFRIALRQLETDASDALMIGDSWTADIEGARAAGIRAVWYNPLRQPCPASVLICAQIHALEPVGEVVETILACGEKSGAPQDAVSRAAPP
jgi:HAD superfamily hydrolase (TIGR01549 family)